MQPTTGDAAFPSPHGRVGLRQEGCRDTEGSQARFECKARSFLCHKKTCIESVTPARFPTSQSSSSQGQQATSHYVFSTKPLTSSIFWESCCCPPITKIHLVYPPFPKPGIRASSWGRKLLEYSNLTGSNFSVIPFISSSYLTAISAF